MAEMEDIAYPEGHPFYGSRHLEMGIDWLEKYHENEPLPPVPIQIATIGKFAERWHRQPQLRLGQMLLAECRMSPLAERLARNGTL